MTAEEARARLGTLAGATVESGEMPLVVRVPVDGWEAAGRFAKDTLGCSYFSFLTAIDWKADGLELIAWLENLDAKLAVQLRTRLGAGADACQSLAAVYRGADWMERECFDMFGVRFVGHPGLRRILLADDWEGHPLRKSYAVDTPHPPYR